MLKEMKSAFNGNIKKIAIGAAASALMVGAVAATAFANTLPVINFEPTTYTLGNINGQQGWTKTGPYDAEVASISNFSNASGFGFETQALRLDNAVTSGSFGDQTFSPGVDPAGEALANKHFEASFDIGSTKATQQPGLFLSVSPDDGNGSRMSYVGFDDQANGIHVIFYDATDPGPLGTVANFNPTDVATINRTSAHSIKFSIDFVPGPGNDVVKLYVDGNIVHTGTTWEDYYRFDPEQAGNGNTVPVTSKLLFREGGAAAAGTAGKGYLVDHVMLSSAPTGVVAHGEITSPANNGDHVSGTLHLAATYDDGDVPNTDDTVQWAVRTGTCAATTGTVLGNVDGHTDTASWDGNTFSFSTDVSSFTPGNYCFIFNPTDDPGQPNVRETRDFVIDANVPKTIHDCLFKGWKNYSNPSFRNQGQCVRYVVRNQLRDRLGNLYERFEHDF